MIPFTRKTGRQTALQTATDIARRTATDIARQTATDIARPAFALAALSLQIFVTSAWAQSSCSSDGKQPPAAFVERFISADCDTCWTDPATPKTKANELALDWIVPTAKGDDAPLSAAATRDALTRLQTLRMQAPATATSRRHTVLALNAATGKPQEMTPKLTPKLTLRVAHGVALGGYMGTSIEMKLAKGSALPHQPLTAWLMLVEEVPAGTDGTPVTRNLIRNSILSTWNINSLLLKAEQMDSQPPTTLPRLYESRPMSIPTGANPDRLRVVGWVEDAKGKVIASAASVCVELK